MSGATNLSSLINALGDGREGLRQFAIRRIVNLGAAAVPELILTLRLKNELIQEGAAIALVTIGEAALPFLLDAMKHEDRAIRWGATWVLSSMPSELRQKLPQFRLPVPQEPETAGKPSDSGMYGVWSDSWLTKVRERLAANKVAEVIKFTEARPAGGAC